MTTRPRQFTEWLRDPSAHFDSPMGLVASAALDRNEKLTLLRVWEENAHAESVAAAEGLGGPGAACVLPAVRAALKSLGARPSGPAAGL